MAEETPRPVARAELLPWHAEAAEQLRTAWRTQRLPHAVLLAGAEGIGKQSFAAWLARSVLCDRAGERPLGYCGECASCALAAAGTHPDVSWVQPDEGKQQISIDQVRSANERLTTTSFRQGYKVAIVEPAHQMTTAAANSVLKTLEEPPAGSLLILVTARPSALPPTVRSRCQKVTMSRPPREQALQWLREQVGSDVDPAVLEFAGGGPLLALGYARGDFERLDETMRKALGALFGGRADVTQIAAEWAQDGLIERLTWLDLWLTSLARGGLAGSADLVTFPSGSAHLPSLPGTLNISGVYSMVDRARTLKAQLARTALQRELAVASWLIALLDTLAPSPAPSTR
jgi:DNA polymerase-3 subunit delta'